MLNITISNRLKNLPYYMYPPLFEAVSKAKEKGLEIIDLSIGEARFSTPMHIVDKLNSASHEQSNHFYNSIQGHQKLREAISKWYKQRYDVDVDPENEVITFHGSKEGLAYLPLSLINQGDAVLIPDPGYFTYAYAAAFAGAKLKTFKLHKSLDFKPDFNSIEQSICRKDKLMYLNYPNNPTGATVDNKFFNKAIEFAQKNNVIICHDAAYSELVFDNYRAPSLLETKGAIDFGIEFNTLSKTYFMTGWRVGYAVGNRKIIKGLLEVKKVISNGNFSAVEMAGKEALENDCIELSKNIGELKKRRNFAIDRLSEIGISIKAPLGTFYVWVPIPEKKNSMPLALEIIANTGVFTLPGIGFGENGDGYIRIALVQDVKTIDKALNKIEPYLKN